MKRLLYHVCDHDVEILDPKHYEENAICFSEHQFLGILGQYLYIFEFDTLYNNFRLDKYPSGGYFINKIMDLNTRYKYESEPIKFEYRISDPIDVKQFCIGKVKNYNALKGILEKYINNIFVEKYSIEKDKILLNQYRNP